MPVTNLLVLGTMENVAGANGAIIKCNSCLTYYDNKQDLYKHNMDAHRKARYTFCKKTKVMKFSSKPSVASKTLISITLMYIASSSVLSVTSSKLPTQLIKISSTKKLPKPWSSFTKMFGDNIKRKMLHHQLLLKHSLDKIKDTVCAFIYAIQKKKK